MPAPSHTHADIAAHRLSYRRRGEEGFALIYTALLMTLLCLFAGLAIDSGRAYLVKAQLTKAVDGAALGAARMLNSANPRQQAVELFNATFNPATSIRAATRQPRPTFSMSRPMRSMQ